MREKNSGVEIFVLASVNEFSRGSRSAGQSSKSIGPVIRELKGQAATSELFLYRFFDALDIDRIRRLASDSRAEG